MGQWVLINCINISLAMLKTENIMEKKVNRVPKINGCLLKNCFILYASVHSCFPKSVVF